MSRRSPADIKDAEDYVLSCLKRRGPATKEVLWDRTYIHMDSLSSLTSALRSLVKAKKVKKKGRTRAMVYTAK